TYIPAVRDVCRVLGGGDGLQLAQGRQTRQGLAFQLTDALTRQIELVPDRLERPGLALETEAKLEDSPLALGERIERAPYALSAERLLGLVERIGRLAVGKEVAELALVVGAHRLVERDGRVRRAERLVDVLHRKTGCLGQLVLRRFTPELDFEPACCAPQLLLALDDVDRDADRAG